MKALLHISLEELAAAKIVKWGYTEELKPLSYNQFSDWIDEGKHGDLSYLSDHRKMLRSNLVNYYSDCKASLSFLFDYRSAKKFQNENKQNLKIASYVTGFEDVDYHFWVGRHLNDIGFKLQKKYEKLEYKISLDVHPVLERDLAFRASLGWIGKNSLLINKDVGSFNIIGSILINQQLPLNNLDFESDHCGNCTACIDACPTNAIEIGTRTLVANKCISFYTIEQFKDDVAAPSGYPTKGKEVFGCDICQDVCPWNKKSLKSVLVKSGSEWDEFFNRNEIEIFDDIQKMSNKEYKIFFKNTSFERLGKKGMLKNLRHYL